MRKILLSSVALFGFTAGALAADLPVRAAPPVFAAPVPVFTWTGFYVGVNAGFAFHGDRDRDNWWGWGAGDQALFGPAPGVWTNITYAGIPVTGNWWDRDRRNDGGFTGGAQVGFNWQMTPGAGLVIGVEADINWLGGGRGRNNDWWGWGGGFAQEATAAPLDPLAAPGFGLLAPTAAGRGNVHLFNTGNNWGNDGRRSDWYATVRARLGWGFDRMLVYATGGLAFADDGGRDNWGAWGFATPAAGFYVSPAAAAAGALVTPTWGNWGGRDRNNVGWTIGGGVEWAFTNNLTLKLEALYVDLDGGNRRDNWWGGAGVNQIVGVTNTGAPVRSGAVWGWGDNRRGGDDFFVVRAGINFKFGS